MEMKISVHLLICSENSDIILALMKEMAVRLLRVQNGRKDHGLRNEDTLWCLLEGGLE